ncbi:cupin domain-containing protein [Leifsonia poae]|uniref:cupin domain-containing protein n=1 Tax=Leifsonia poae TaxID=110933 RepID=UPI001CC094C8|nr:cupin domain-containing protein [Leifsonia poae]
MTDHPAVFDGTARVAASTVELTHEPVPEEQREAGSPTTGLLELGTFGALEVGVWEMTPGEMTDVEADEMFVVIAGHATIAFLDTGLTLTVGPGDVVRLSAGDRTRWTVTSTLRKIYLTE